MFRYSSIFFVALALSCGGSGKSPKKVQGGEGQVCFSDGACNVSLFCVEGICRGTLSNNTTNNINPNINPNNTTNINPNNQSFCNDGVVDPGESCDGADTNGQSCFDFGFDGGFLGCTELCTFDITNCSTDTVPVCGNGIIEAGEICDAADLQGFDCRYQGYAGGELRCSFDCTFFDESSCTDNACGNGFIEAGEVCDGADLGGNTCQSRGYDGGVLRCNSACAAFDASQCTSCGNNAVEGNEVCDGTNVNGQTCASLGLDGTGTVRCNPTCSDYDVSACETAFVCDLPAMNPACGVNDAATCVCEGCVDDNVCAGDDDCVCPDCRNDAVCGSATNCANDGKCDPFNEGCVCADCAGHPRCAP